VVENLNNQENPKEENIEKNENDEEKNELE
jgi:hypothetical protein